MDYLFLHNTGPAGNAAEKLDDRAKHRVNAGLRYNLFEKTLLLLDYKYQEKQIAYVCEEEPNGFIKDGVLKFYVNNLLDEEYENSRGYPMTDRTFGVALSFRKGGKKHEIKTLMR